jgi:integrase
VENVGADVLVTVMRWGIRTFDGYLAGQGLADKTVRIYGKAVDRAILYFAEHGGALELVSAADLAGFATTLPASTSSRRQTRSALHYWFEWMEISDPGLKAIRVPPKPRYYCQAVSELEARRLVRAALDVGHPQGSAVLSGLYLALRVSEIAAMRWDRFDLGFEHYTVTGKGDYTARLPVHGKLRQYLQGCQTPYIWVFPGERGRTHVTPTTVWGWVRDVGERCGIHDLRTHQLRHTALATMNDRTGDLRATSEFARPRRLETTMLYTRTTEDGLRKVMNALDY